MKSLMLFRKRSCAITLLFTLFFVSACKDDDPVPGTKNPVFDLKLYKPGSSINGKSLQLTLISENIQYSAFGSFSSNGNPEPAAGAYIFDRSKKEETIMLLDEKQEPAYLYGVNSKTGTKKQVVTEFEKIDSRSFYLRMYHYDWTNRLGTLLFETVMEKSGDKFTSKPTFQIGDPTFTGGRVAGKTAKSFPVPLKRLHHLSAVKTAGTAGGRVSGGIIEDFQADLDLMRNSVISDGLRWMRNAGAVLMAIGVPATLSGAPVGPLLVIGGAALTYGAGATDMVLSDHARNFLTSVKDKFSQVSNFSGQELKIGESTVSTYTGYSHDAEEHMIENAGDIIEDYSSLSDWISQITEEALVEEEDLNDLPSTEGVLQIGLSWTTNGTDIDLWVTDPYGEKIYFANENSDSGGYLDRDDVDGYGPENIYWVDNIPDGQYLIQVHYYAPSGGPVTPYTVKVVNGLGFSKTFQGTLAGDEDLDTVAVIVKDGQVLSVQ